MKLQHPYPQNKVNILYNGCFTGWIQNWESYEQGFER